MEQLKSLFREDPADFKFTSWVLLVSNFIPLLGVLFWGWSTFAIVVIYWGENVVLGVINLLKMLFCSPDRATLEAELKKADASTQEMREQLKFMNSATGLRHAAKLFIMPFFAFHYGMFCFVHGVFVFVLLGNQQNMEFPSIGAMFKSLEQNGLIWAVAALALSHLVSFAVNYIWRGEYRRCTLTTLMMQPYGRIVVLHLAILLGAFATIALGSPIFILLILIVGKTVLDLKFHLRERRKNSEHKIDQNQNGQYRGNEGFGAGAQ